MKFRPNPLFRKLLFIVAFLFSSFVGHANHLVGLDLFYTHVTGNTYKITLIAYGDCGSASGSSSAFAILPTNSPKVYIYNGSLLQDSVILAIQPPSAGIEITPVCPAYLSLTQCTNLSLPTPGIKKFVYSVNYTLPASSAVWRFMFTGDLGGSSAGRALSITNIPSTPVTSTQLVDTLNNLAGPNSNPTLTNVPTPFFCLSTTNNYNPGAVDPNADSLRFYLVPGYKGTTTSAYGSPVPYIAPYTGANPLAVSSMTFDQETGQISFNPSSLQRSLVVYNIREFRGGNFVGSCQREMTFLVQACTSTPPNGNFSAPTAGTVTDNTHFNICQNSGAFSINIDPYEAVTTNNIYVATSGLPAGLTFVTTGNGTPTPHCLISWTSTGTAPGSYTFFVTYSDNNCPLAGTQTIAYTITVLPAATVAYTVLSAANCLQKAAISINPSGGGGPWKVKVSYAASPFDTFQTFTGVTGAFTDSLLAGSYNITIFTAGTGCKNSIGVTLTAPTFPAPTVVTTNPSHCGNNNGTIKLSGLTPGLYDTVKFYKGGVLQPIQVHLVASDGSITLSGLIAGTYSNISVTNGRYCVTPPVGPFVLVNPPFTMRTLTTVSPSVCGYCDGTITLFGLHPGLLDTINYYKSSVLQPPVISFIGADSTAVISGLCPGYYHNITAKTAGVCVTNTLGPLTLTAPPFTARAVSFTNPPYCGICTGTITIYGLHPFMTDTITYLKDGVAQPPVVFSVGSDSIAIIAGLCQGVYSNIVARTGGICVSNTLGPVTLIAPPFTMRALTHTNPPYCGICTGTITLYGLHPYQTDTITYIKDGIAQPPVVFTIGADSTVVLTGLCAGVYSNFVARTGGVCVSNVLGPVTLTVPPFTMRALDFTDPLFCGVCTGTITLYGLYPGQVDTIHYTKSGVAQPPLVFTVALDSTVTLTGLCAGLYDNFVARTGGICVSNTLGPANLTVPPFTMRAIDHTNPDYCGTCNGVIRLYGLYPGHTDTVSYTKGGVAQPPHIQVVGADSVITITGLCDGVYSNFIARTGGECESNTLGPVTLTVPPFTVRALTFTNPPYCGICTGTITLHGLYPGLLDTISYTKTGVPQPAHIQLVGADSTITITGLCDGVYDNFVATTGGHCVSNTLGPAVLTVPPFSMRALTFTNPAFCGICTGTITLYGLYPGQTDTINFTQNGFPHAPIVRVVPPDSTIVISGLCAGLYDNFVARTGGVCVSNVLGPANLTVPPFTMRDISSTNPSKCGWCDGRIKLYGLHPGQTDTIYFMRNGVSQTPVSYTVGVDSIVYLSGLCDGVYSDFVAKTAAVCVSNTLGPVTLVDPPIIPAFTFVNHMSCKVDTLVFTNFSTPAADLTYKWYFGDGDSSSAISPAHLYYSSGNYKVTLVITNTRCVDSVTHIVAITNILKAGFFANPSDFVCTGEPVTFTDTSRGVNLRYAWTYGDGGIDTTASNTHIYTRTGKYNVFMAISNDGPCKDTARTTIEVDSISEVSIRLTDSVLCDGHTVTFTGIYAGIGCTGTLWTFGDSSIIANVNPVVHAFDANGALTVRFDAHYRACPDTFATRKVWVFSHPQVYIGHDTSICPGSNPITLKDNNYQNVPSLRWLWSTGEKTSSIKVAAPGVYWVKMLVDGCTTSDSVIVVRDCFMDIPNAFTPNADGINEFFLPRPLLAKGLSMFKLTIFNRWGQTIFETDRIEGRGWDGKLNGLDQPEGVYVYLIDATFLDGQQEKIQGNVTLIR